MCRRRLRLPQIGGSSSCAGVSRPCRRTISLSLPPPRSLLRPLLPFLTSKRTFSTHRGKSHSSRAHAFACAQATRFQRTVYASYSLAIHIYHWTLSTMTHFPPPSPHTRTHTCAEMRVRQQLPRSKRRFFGMCSTRSWNFDACITGALPPPTPPPRARLCVRARAPVCVCDLEYAIPCTSHPL